MRIRLSPLAIAFIAVVLLTSQSHAQNACEALGLKTANLSDRQMFVETDGAWTEYSSVPALNLRAATKKRCVYVIKLQTGQPDRSGILIIKSNRVANPEDTANVKSEVRLVRKRITQDPGCPYRADWVTNMDATVSTDSYEDYHDFRAKDTAALRQYETTLKSFHFEYDSAAYGRCIRTDSKSEDSFPLTVNSNRAQFSFNSTVVENGVHPVWRLAFRVPSPFVGTAENRTRAVKYKTTQGTACVEFKIPVMPQEYVIRVNDLEGREINSSQRRPEKKQWP